MDINKLKDLLTISDGDTDVEIRIGWHTIARIEIEDGAWYPSVRNTSGNWIYINGMSDNLTKEQAFNKIVERFK